MARPRSNTHSAIGEHPTLGSCHSGPRARVNGKLMARVGIEPTTPRFSVVGRRVAFPALWGLADRSGMPETQSLGQGSTLPRKDEMPADSRGLGRIVARADVTRATSPQLLAHLIPRSARCRVSPTRPEPAGVFGLSGPNPSPGSRPELPDERPTPCLCVEALGSDAR